MEHGAWVKDGRTRTKTKEWEIIQTRPSQIQSTSKQRKRKALEICEGVMEAK